MKLTESLGASAQLCYKQLGRGWGTSKHNCLVSYFIMLTTTCFGRCGPFLGHKNIYIHSCDLKMAHSG